MPAPLFRVATRGPLMSFSLAIDVIARLDFCAVLGILKPILDSGEELQARLRKCRKRASAYAASPPVAFFSRNASMDAREISLEPNRCPGLAFVVVDLMTPSFMRL